MGRLWRPCLWQGIQSQAYRGELQRSERHAMDGKAGLLAKQGLRS